MATESHTELIAKRRAVISARVAELRAEIDTLVAEEGELDMAERVLQRLSPMSRSRMPMPGEPREQASAMDLDNDNNDNDDEAAISITTVPGMITAVVQEVFSEDHRGVTGSEIFSTIRKRWRPGIKSDNVRPVIWRLAKAERIKKRGKFYYPPVEASAAAK